MAVVNAREWMEEPLLKACIDPPAALEESEGLNVTQGFLSAHKGVDGQVPLNKDVVSFISKVAVLLQKRRAHYHKVI